MDEKQAEAIATLASQWLPVYGQLALLGVKSFRVIHALMSDAGHDDATIAALQPQWDALYDRVSMAAEGRSDRVIPEKPPTH